MAARVDRVVKVDELNTAGSVHFREDTLFKDEVDSNVGENFALPSSESGDESGSRMEGATSSNGVTTEANDIDMEDDDLPSEAEDQIMPLPENWPKIPQIFQKRSWNFSTAVSPTINKATSHLELLQNIVEEWCKDIDSESMSRASSKAPPSRGPSQASSAGGGKRQLRFSSGSSASKSSPLKMGRHATETPDSGNSRGLTIEGLGGFSDSLQVHSKPQEPQILDAPYLGADEVIDEVITLLAKLENDRQETLDKLKTERHRVGMLGGKIDSLAFGRLTELPSAVQNEHEACAMDITELNWHVNYSARTEKRIRTKTEVADALNIKLKEDIEFVRSHVPLVREKLELELDAMSRIKQAQGDTTDELGKTKERCTRVNDKSEEAHVKAEQERAVIKRDLDQVKDDLTSISEELADAKMTQNAYIQECNDLRKQLVDNKQELQVLEVKNENAKVAEAMQLAKVEDLEVSLGEADAEHKRLDEDNRAMGKKFDDRQAKNQQAENKLKKSIDTKEDKLKKVTRRNKELDMDIEDCEIKSKTFDRHHAADERNVDRMRKELGRTEEQLSTSKEDLANVNLSNIAIREQLKQQEEKCLAVEEQLRATADALRKQITEELHTKTVMSARIQSDSSDLVKSQAETKNKKERASAKANEVVAAVKIVQEKVEKLRKAHDEKMKAIADLENEIQAVNEERKQMEEANQKEINEISPNHKATKDALVEQEKKLDHMDWKTDLMRKKMEDMHASSGMMSRAVNKTQTSIDALQEELDELNIVIQSTQSIMEDLKSAIATIDSRHEMLDKNQRDMMKERNNVHAQHQKDLEDNIKLNKEIASKYRRLQIQYLALKNEMLNKYDGRVKLENAIKDTRQLQSLQKKMNAALLEYFKFRGLYNQNELTRMDKESRTSGVKVSKLQVQMDMALDKISDFLKNQLDGDTVRHMAMEKVAAEERGEVVAYESRPTTAATSIATAY